MSDESVRAALRSEAPLVVVEAPAGCGKTKSGADYALDLARTPTRYRPLVVTHTHAACSVFGDRTVTAGSRVEIRTIDSVIAQIASAYHAGLDLPSDIPSWTMKDRNNHAILATKVATLLKKHPMIASSLAHRHGVVICDEHQDSSGDQHSIVMSLYSQGAKLRIFGDPMQKIFEGKTAPGGDPAYEWTDLSRQAQSSERLDVPHRWADGCPYLGEWTLAAREDLKAGQPVNLRKRIPPSVTVLFAENRSRNPRGFQLSPHERKGIDRLERSETSLLVLTRYNPTAESLRSFFYRRIPLWEGHTRERLEKLVQGMTAGNGNPSLLADAVCEFVQRVGTGFSASEFGDRFKRDVRDGCTKRTSGKPAEIQKLGRLLLSQPDHRGVASVLLGLVELAGANRSFANIKIDRWKEYWDAIRLSRYQTPEIGLAEIAHHRTHSRPKPPPKAISTIHKAKGLECDSTILLHCDAIRFPDNPESRCLLYVALSRAKKRLMIVASREHPSPLLSI